MKSIKELVSYSLIGTDRVNNDISDPDFNEAINSYSDKEAKLLLIAAMSFKYNLSGKLPEKDESISINVAEKETSEFITEKMLSLIDKIFTDHLFLLPEFLNLLNETNKVFPEYLLPRLLSEGVKNKDYQELIVKAVGKRGLWLAKQNKAWNYLFDENLDEEEIWKTETTQIRVNLLKRIRKKDPQKAITFLTSTWKEEAAQNKVKFLETLEENLSLNDEEFLESALDDKRSSEVRRKASELLGKIPDSKLIRRMSQRFGKLISLETRKDKVKVNLEVIDKPDNTLLRDIGEDKLGLTSFEAKENFVYNFILNKIPLSFFTEKFKKSPEEIIGIFAKDKKAIKIFNHLVSQTLKEKNAEWAKILITYSDNDYVAMVLAKTEKEKIIISKLKENFEKGFALLNSYNESWSYDFSYNLLKTIIEEANKNVDNKKFYYFYNFSNLAIYFDPYVYEKAEKEILPLISDKLKENNTFMTYLGTFMNTIRLRYDITKEFKQ